MNLEDKITDFLPSFQRLYDAPKINNAGPMERFHKLLASEIDGKFLLYLNNLHNATNAKTIIDNFLAYEENLRGTLRLHFDFAAFSIEEGAFSDAFSEAFD